jgi:Na+/H+-dicarboxylate symporter
VDHFLDMGRTATNVIGNAVAAAVVARWEGQLDRPEEAEIAVAPAAALPGDADSFEDYAKG